MARELPYDDDGWPGEAPDAAVARVALQVDAAVTLERRAEAARLTAHGDAVPALPIKPSSVELAVVIALAQTYGSALVDDMRFLPVIDFIADYGAVLLVQRVMYGDAMIVQSTEMSANEQLTSLLDEARRAFEFLCGTWPEIFMQQANNALTRLGLPPWLPHHRSPPQSDDGEGRDES